MLSYGHIEQLQGKKQHMYTFIPHLCYSALICIASLSFRFPPILDLSHVAQDLGEH
jgi:hypothetical protein